jgi:SnoaL-like domain
MMTHEELAAREEIRGLLAKYNLCGDRADFVGLASVFTADGLMESELVNARGREQIAAQLAALMRDPERIVPAPGNMQFSRHNLTTSQLEFESESTARGRTYFFVISDIGLDHAGVYVDNFAKSDGEWRISRRRIRIDYCAPGGHAPATR